MADDSDRGLTRLQRQIIHTVVRGPDSANDIADNLDCSASYVRQVKREHEGRVEAATDLSNINYVPIFSKPYSILFKENTLDHLSLTEGDLLELTCSYEGETETTYGKVQQLESDFNTKLLELRRLENLKYNTTSSLTVQSDLSERAIKDTGNGGTVESFLTVEDYLGLCLAITIEDAILLIDENQTGLWKFSHLFGVDALQLTSQAD